MEPIDHTEFLVKIHDTQELAQLLLQRLEENADTEAKQATVERIRLVIELQSTIIKGLVEENLSILDRLEEVITKIESQK